MGEFRLPSSETVRVVVGQEQREFVLHRKLLCSATPFFQDRLDAAPAGLTWTQSRRPPIADPAKNSAVVWLAGERSDVFEVFILWLYSGPRAFRKLMDNTIATMSPNTPTPSLSRSQNKSHRNDLHWRLVRLHIFAALAGLPALQDACLDAIQDMYLRCDWTMSTDFVEFLYRECDAEQAFRLRKWAVAMIAWAIHIDQPQSSGSVADSFQPLLDNYPILRQDYEMHLAKMASSKADLGIKNPQLRLPGNRFRNEERSFGFRQCSFHSHRRRVGEGHCLHSIAPPLVQAPWTTARRKAGKSADDSSMSSDESVLSPPATMPPSSRSFQSLHVP